MLALGSGCMIMTSAHLSIQAFCVELCSLLLVLPFVLKTLFYIGVRYQGEERTLIKWIHGSLLVGQILNSTQEMSAEYLLCAGHRAAMYCILKYCRQP